MEVIKCNLCKDEIAYSQKCRVYIQSDVPRPTQRISKRPHLGRYKLISTAKSTEHISFARRLKALRKKKIEKVYTGNPKDNSKSNLEVHPVKKEIPRSEKKKVECRKSKLNFLKESQIKSITEKLTKEFIEKEAEDTSTKELKNSTTGEGAIETDNTNCGSPEQVEKEEAKISSTPQLQNSASIKMSQPKFQNSFEEYLKPIISKTTASKIIKTKSSDSCSEIELNRKGSTNTYRPTKNGNSRNSLQEFETYYWLDMPKAKAPETKKLGYQFENLVTEVKHMKLPSPEWKIKIMVHKQEMVSVSFSNRKTPEKVVTVNAKNLVCDISIDNKKLTLLGSPVYIYTIKDLEILLDIMNNIEVDSSFIQYL